MGLVRVDIGMTRWESVVSAVVVVTLLATFGNAQEIGHSAAGRAAAKHLCSRCHAVEKEETYSPEADALSFQQLARTPGMTAAALSAALGSSHLSIPMVLLEAEEKADIIAYILSLR
jgi:cytochrome c553